MRTYHFAYMCWIPGTDNWKNTISIKGSSIKDAQNYLSTYLKDKYKHLRGEYWDVCEVSEEEARIIALNSWSFRPQNR